MVVLAVLMLVGGVIGFKKAKSKASLISGIVSCILLGVCFAVTLSQQSAGLMGGFVVTCLLDVVFIIRLSKTKKFMPAGMMLIVVVITQAILGMALFGSPQQQ